jgi:hypothetical protein
MMAHHADFHGDQLRLNAFLRVMGKVPERPKRLQRNRQALSPLLIQNDSASANQLSIATPAPDGDAFLPEDLMPEFESCGTTPSSSAIDDHVSPLGSTPCATEPSETHATTNLDSEQLKLDVAEATLAIKRKKKVVYTSKKKQSKQPMAILNARNRHPLPGNGLVFVRASTEDGLPLPGVRT